MDWGAACAAVIPCLNEQETIGPVVKAVREQLPTVIVVDDGSADDTAAIAREAGAIVLKNACTLGKGAALQAGWAHGRKTGCQWALSMDGDGQHSPGDISMFLRCAERTGAPLVIGDRMSEAARIPLIRRWVNRWMSRQLSNLTGQLLPDSQCGFRLMNLEEWARLPVRARYFEIESEVLVLFAKAGLAIEFVPIQAIYKQEQSKIHPLRDTVRWLSWYREAKHRGLDRLKN
jgi:glycosyltransferase involved in cell wall biosynthesis